MALIGCVIDQEERPESGALPALRFLRAERPPAAAASMRVAIRMPVRVCPCACPMCCRLGLELPITSCRKAPPGPNCCQLRCRAASSSAGRSFISSAQAREPMISAPASNWLPNGWSPLEWVLTSRPAALAAGGAHAGQHFGRQGKIEQGIDQEALEPVGDQPGIAPAPAAVGLQPGEAAVAEIVQTLAVVPLGHDALSSPRLEEIGRRKSTNKSRRA